MKKTIIIIVLALSFVGCQKTGELTTEDRLLEFGYEGGTRSLNFDITEKWTAKLNDGAAQWCTIDANAGGKDLSGTVNWGDEQSDSQGDDYTQGHTYASEGTKTVEYTILGADSFTIKSLDSITGIIILSDNL